MCPQFREDAPLSVCYGQLRPRLKFEEDHLRYEQLRFGSNRSCSFKLNLFLLLFCRGTAQAQRIQVTSSVSWWRSELSAARHVGCVTLSGWTTASSCQPPSRRPPIEVDRALPTHTPTMVLCPKKPRRWTGVAPVNTFCFNATRGAAGVRGQEEGCWGEHAGTSRTSESTDPLHRLPAGLHGTRERPRLLELSAASQVSWSQVRSPSLTCGVDLVHVHFIVACLNRLACVLLQNFPFCLLPRVSYSAD